jgi:nitrate reductase gamma subunit
MVTRPAMRLALHESSDRRAVLVGAGATIALAAAIAVGSRGLRDYDIALLPYTIGVLFAAFAVTYRYAVWLQRPATAVYWTRGWQLIFARGRVLRNVLELVRSGADSLMAQRFIKHRSTRRWLAHFCFAWGCTIAAAVTFPLVFGWIHFETRATDTHTYQVVVFGRTVQEFAAESIPRYVMFNLLNVSAVLVIFGTLIALHRRITDREATSRQSLGNDIVPLLLLLAIALTGLLLTASTHLLHGYGYSKISVVHAVVVTATLLSLPFGKLFHVFQRPAQLSVTFYKRASAQSPPAVCRGCGDAFAGSLHVDDLKRVLREVDLDWSLKGPVSHYADVCPRCRRRLFGLVQGQLMGR